MFGVGVGVLDTGEEVLEEEEVIVINRGFFEVFVGRFARFFYLIFFRFFVCWIFL